MSGNSKTQGFGGTKNSTLYTSFYTQCVCTSNNQTLCSNSECVVSCFPDFDMRFYVHQSVWPTESAHVWGELSEAILRKDWEKAREAKQEIEERQRKLLKERESKGETWVSKHFVVSNNKEGWECSPIQNTVPAAPITAQ